MKQWICLILSIIIVLCTPLSVSAADDYKDLQQQIITAMETGERLDISSYKLNREEMEKVYSDLFHRGLLPWYADSFCDWTAASDGTIAAITLRDLRKRSFSEDSYECAMAELIAQTCHDGMTDLQKVLCVHDHIVARAEYSYLDATNNGYHALVKGTTACYGYAQLFLRIMNRLGIPCQIVTCDDTGDGLGHAWNIVELDGSWYHLDLTWDDPLPNAPNRALHTYFLKTDKEFKESLRHDFGWDQETSCTDTTFASDNLWDGIDSPILFQNAETMLLRQNSDDGSAIYAVDTHSGKKSQLCHISADSFSTGLCYWNNRIWFNTIDAVYSIKPDGTDLKTEYTYENATPETYIYGFLVEDGTITVSLLRIQNDDYRISKETIKLKDVLYHEHVYEASYVSAACDKGGYTQKTCSCGITYQIERTNPTGHTFAEDPMESTPQRHCINCDYISEETIPSTEPVHTDPLTTEAAMPVYLVPVIICFLVIIVIVGILLFKKKKQ